MGYFRETFKSQNVNSISPTPKFNLAIIHIIIKSMLTIFSGSGSSIKDIYLSVYLQYLTFQSGPDVRSVCKVKVFVYMLVYISFHLI